MANSIVRIKSLEHFFGDCEFMWAYFFPIIAATYGAKLAAVIQKMILISEVARLARVLARDSKVFNRKTASEALNWDFPSYGDALLRVDDDDDGDDDDEADSALSKSPRSTGDVNIYNKSLKSSERLKLLKLLDQWEEPAEERSVVS